MSTDAPQARPCPTCKGHGHLVFIDWDDDMPRAFHEPVDKTKTRTEECPECHGSRRQKGLTDF